MNRAWALLFVAAYPAILLAQSGTSGTDGSSAPYQPAVPQASTGGFYGGWPGYYGGASTAAGAALNGMAGVISAKGDYNLSTSAAAVNMTQAQKNEIQNRQQWTNTYFSMRETNRQARDAERGPPPTMEQLARIAKQGAPRPLSPSQFDPVTGKIHWPAALRTDGYATQRGELDQLFTAQAKYGALNYSDQETIRAAIDAMLGELKGQIKKMPPAEYTACRSFLDSLAYAATRIELQ